MTPRITLALMAYNQERTVDAALRSALGQVCEPIEILVSDDCSTDGTFGRIERLVGGYRGPHRVVARRQGTNLRAAEHFNALMEAAAGRLVVMMHADDVSRRDRVARVATAWDASGERLDLIASHVVDLDAAGHEHGTKHVDALQDWRSVADWERRRPYIIGAAHAVTQRLFRRFGPLAPACLYEDQVNALRAVLAGGGAWTIDDALVGYRRGGISSAEHSAATYRSWEARRSAIHLAMYDQWARDAATCGLEEQVRRAVQPERQRDDFLHRLLAAPSLREQVRLVRRHPAADPRWRCKHLLKARMFPGYEVARKLRSRARALATVIVDGSERVRARARP
jgi:glycosyltransferase involved in cell wall biosynthesis